MIAASADWSVAARKRWITLARRQHDRWRLSAARPVGNATALLSALTAEAGGAPVALGLDVPIGVPFAYAERHARRVAADFPAFLRRLTDRPDFFRVADSVHEVSPERPVYPALWRQGSSAGRGLHAAALGLADPGQMLRLCDRPTDSRPAAAPLFWTLGPNQVGKAALHAWREVLIPALIGPAAPGLWPFDGPLSGLLAGEQIAVCEVYPAEALRQIGLRPVGSKRRQRDRSRLGALLGDAMLTLRAAPEPALAADLADGFGADPSAEDRMDSFIGLLGLLNVLEGNRPDTAPPDPPIAHWEGWILGQSPP